METKKGISIVVLAITLIVMAIIASISIMSIDNIIKEANKNEFATELQTIKDKVQEWYLFTGNLPVKTSESFTQAQLVSKISDTAQQALLRDEIRKNNDVNNTFLVVDLELMEVETNERGKGRTATDIFVVATNTLNVYYLGGVEVEDKIRFSVVDLANENEIADDDLRVDSQVTLNNELNLTKSVNVWTNELTITVKNSLDQSQTLNYSIGGAEVKSVPTNNVIKINASNMTEAEKQAFATSKTVTVNKLEGESIIETKQIELANLDIVAPSVGDIELVDSTQEDYNVIKVNGLDEGGSGVRAIYYDYLSKSVEGVTQSYYTDRSEVTITDLINFGKISADGQIKLDKDIVSIVLLIVDNASNISLVETHTIIVE